MASSGSEMFPSLEEAVLPNMDHYRLSDEAHVYAPAEDTYLLCDVLATAVSQDALTRNRQRPKVVVEVGPGSGCVTAYLLSRLKSINETPVRSVAIDINPAALEMTQRTAAANGVDEWLETREGDLLTPWTEGPVIDVLIFNPPYVPSEPEEVGTKNIEAAWAGGLDGREVTDRFLPQIKSVLAPEGVCYLVLIRENKPEQIRQLLATKYGLEGTIIGRKQAVNEALMIMRIVHK